MKLNSKLLSLALPLLIASLALATPNPKPSAKPPPPPPPPPPKKKCEEELFCCLSLSAWDAPSTKSLLGLLGVHLTLDEEKLSVGLTCSPIFVKRDDSTIECFFKTVCCEKEFGGGLLAIGCSEF